MVIPWLTIVGGGLSEQRSLWPKICLNPALDLILFSWVLICEEVEKENSVIKCKQKTDFAEIAHSALGCVWCLRCLGGSRTGRRAGTAPALGTGHLPGDGVRLRPDQDISPNTHRPSLLLLWHPPSFHAARILLIKLVHLLYFTVATPTLKYIYMHIIIHINALKIRWLLYHNRGDLSYQYR